MKLNINVKDEKAIISWSRVKADYFRVLCKINDEFIEYAKVYDLNYTVLSLLPYGENCCYVQGIKNGIVVGETKKTTFEIKKIDTLAFKNESDEVQIFYSKHPQADAYRLYKDYGDNNFFGQKNYYYTNIAVEHEKNASYKIKPCKIREQNKRDVLCSSAPFKCMDNSFEMLSVYKSFGDKLFISWLFKGKADGFMVFQEGSDYPIFDANDELRHYLEVSNYNIDTKFYIKAYVSSPNGKIIVATSDKVSYSVPVYGEPKISIIIPAYNSYDYIARTIDTALASTFKDIEIIVVNDESTDNTQEVIDWYKNQYSNVVSIMKKNGGVADARNFGIQAAKGEYIAFMDNDDIIRPNMLEVLYNAIKKDNCDIAIAPLYRMVRGGYTTHCNLPFEVNKAYDIDEYLKIAYTPGYYNCAIWNKLYRASMVKEHPLGILKYEDVSWTPCILSYAKTFCYIDTPLYEWDRRLREETFGEVLAKMPEDDLFEHRRQAMMFFVEKGNPEKLPILKEIAIRRLKRYNRMSNGYPKYNELIKTIEETM